MPTKFNKDTKKREPVTFKKGDIVAHKCKAGFTLDGSKDGDVEFDVECSDTGFFKPKGVCMKASKCGAAPVIAHAAATGVEVPGKVQYACSSGFSLDGEKVVAGGMGKNSIFELECVEFSGSYEKFKGECKPYAFMPAKETTRIYTQVFEALFTVTCEGKLNDAFGAGKSAPVDTACAKLKNGSGSCAGLVADIKSAFADKKKALKGYKEEKEWWDTKGKPGVTKESTKFCTELWKLVEKPNDL